MRLRGFGFLLGCVLAASPGCVSERPGGTADTPTGNTAGARPGRDARTPGRAPGGYVLFSPLLSYTTYLVDRAGRVVHTWESDFPPGVSEYLLDDGRLLRCARQPEAPVFHQGGSGGRIQEFGWDGELLWDWVVASERRLQHHDIEPLPNGNVLLIAWEYKSREEAIRAGRDPSLVGSQGLWPDCVLEVRPDRPKGGRVVWEWHLWDHLIQDHDPGRENYGRVPEHPELIDINGDRSMERLSEEALERLRALGYVGGGAGTRDRHADLTHVNSIAYNPHLDQIALSVLFFNEIWIIDHGTTTEEAAGHSGGRAGRGGDLLYRWGNPRAYGRGGAEDQQLFAQHDARWIPEGYPGAGNILVFNNGAERLDRLYSSVIEIAPPLDSRGRYAIKSGSRFGPDGPAWEYTAPEKGSFFADFISGAHRLPDGGTFICSGPQGRFFEVAANGEIVWEYENPYSGDAPNPAGDPPYSVFRATLLAADHPALAGRDLRPLDPQPARMRPRQSSRQRQRPDQGEP